MWFGDASRSEAKTPTPCDASIVANLTQKRNAAQNDVDKAGLSVKNTQTILDALPSDRTHLIVPNFAVVPVQNIATLVPGGDIDKLTSISDLIRPVGSDLILHNKQHEYLVGQVLDTELALIALKTAVGKGDISSKDASRVIAGLLRYTYNIRGNNRKRLPADLKDLEVNKAKLDRTDRHLQSQQRILDDCLKNNGVNAATDGCPTLIGEFPAGLGDVAMLPFAITAAWSALAALPAQSLGAQASDCPTTTITRVTTATTSTVPPTSLGAAPRAGFTGTFSTSYGEMRLVNGSGPYDYSPPGTISGAVTFTTSGWVLDGRWTQPNGSGRVHFELDRAGSFSGNWTRDPASESQGGWSGQCGSPGRPAS